MCAHDTSSAIRHAPAFAVNTQQIRDSVSSMASDETKDMIEGAPRRRDRPVPVPGWWLEQARDLFAQWKKETGKGLVELGRELAERVGRDKEWNHGTVSRFLDGQGITDGLVRAFATFFDIPLPVYYPRDLVEAIAFKRAVDGQGRATKDAPSDKKAEIVDSYKEQVADIERSQSRRKGQGKGVEQPNARGTTEFATRGRPPGRMGTRRKTTR
jgi:hypothetical protein